MNWRLSYTGRRGGKEQRDGREIALSKALPVRRGDWNRKKRSPRLAVFRLRRRAHWSPLLFFSGPLDLPAKVGRPSSSFCPLCSQTSKHGQSYVCGNTGFSLKSANSVHNTLFRDQSIASQIMLLREGPRRKRRKSHNALVST